MNKKYVKTLVVLTIAALLLFAVTAVAFAAGDEETASNAPAIITLVVLGIAAVLFITEIIPLAVTSMCIPIALTVTGVVSPSSAFSGLSNSNVILFAGMFVVGGALFETGVAKLIGDFVVKISRGSESVMMLGVMIFTATLSSVLSNTGTVAVMLPVCIGIADAGGFARGRLLLPLAMMASLGGMISLVGTPPNNTVTMVLGDAGYRTFGFFEFAWIGIPLTIAGIIYLMTIGKKLLPKTTGKVDDSHVHNVGLAQKKQPKSKQIISTAILLICVVIMATEIMPLHVAAVAGAMLAVITGCISEKEAYNAIDWTTIFLFAGTLSLATALDQTGAGKMVANAVIGLVGESTSPYVLMTACFILSAGLTQFMSNTASCALLAPIGLHIAAGMGASPHAILMTIGIAASAAFATPIATPPNTLVLGPGGLKFMDYVKIGLPLLLITYIGCLLIIPRVWPFYG